MNARRIWASTLQIADCRGLSRITRITRIEEVNLTLTGAFQRIMIECKLDSYYDEPNIVYLTPIALLETAT